MSGNPNKSARFRQMRDGYRSKYTDQNGNKWRIDVDGTAEQVQWFVKNKPCHCSATPQSQDSRTAQDGSTRKPSATLGATQTKQPRKSTTSLAVTITLEQIADESKPYTVHFEIDPDLGADNNEHTHTFQLVGNDASADINCQCDNGTVRMRLEGSGMNDSRGPGDNLDLTILGAPLNSNWVITVMRETGNPVYTLTGDFNINEESF